MQIVIDIPEEYHENLLKNYRFSSEEIPIVSLAIATGTPLPKGHGRLIDADAINEQYYSIYIDAMNCSNKPSDKYLLDKWSVCLDTSPTIIEADEVEE